MDLSPRRDEARDPAVSTTAVPARETPAPATGEGKTLVGSLPAFLHGLQGQGTHVTTVNDYLARRDAELMGPIFRALGLTVGVLQMQMADGDRREAYRADVTYGTASEFGFD